MGVLGDIQLDIGGVKGIVCEGGKPREYERVKDAGKVEIVMEVWMRCSSMHVGVEGRVRREVQSMYDQELVRGTKGNEMRSGRRRIPRLPLMNVNATPLFVMSSTLSFVFHPLH